MKRYSLAVLAGLIATVALTAPALAVPRVPQIAFSSASLQARMNGYGESINVNTQQQDGLVWGSTISTNSTMTIQFELTGPAHLNEIGIAKLGATNNFPTGLAPVFPPTAGTGWFAVASFRPGNALIVNLFDPNAALVSTTSYSGVDRTKFAYYVKNTSGTFYSHDGLNTDTKAHALAFAGTGQNAGSWWLTWEDAPIGDLATADFDDALLFLESLNPTPVTHSTWGSLKARFR